MSIHWDPQAEHNSQTGAREGGSVVSCVVPKDNHVFCLWNASYKIIIKYANMSQRSKNLFFFFFFPFRAKAVIIWSILLLSISDKEHTS